MKAFFLANLLLLAFAYLGQFEFWVSGSSELGEQIILGYAAFLIHFLFLLTFSIYLAVADREKKGKSLERQVVFWIVAPYASLTWRFKFAAAPIASSEWQLFFAVLFLLLWWIKGREIIAGFERFAMRSMGKGIGANPRRGALESLSYMRIIALIMIVLPVPFWHVRSIFFS